MNARLKLGLGLVGSSEPAEWPEIVARSCNLKGDLIPYIDHEGYRYHIFEGSGFFHVYAPFIQVDYLLVGGGGSGGKTTTGGCGGGGAGGLKTDNITMLKKTFDIIVGGGGAGRSLDGQGYNGDPSRILDGENIVSETLGGGGGGRYSSTPTGNGLDGGSGGGAGGPFSELPRSGGEGLQPDTETEGLGNKGADTLFEISGGTRGGGGGGATGEGQSGPSHTAAIGGTGFDLNALWSLENGEIGKKRVGAGEIYDEGGGWFAGGGGGNRTAPGRAGGGKAGNADNLNTPTIPNTGSGSGATHGGDSPNTFPGADGICIIRYQID